MIYYYRETCDGIWRHRIKIYFYGWLTSLENQEILFFNFNKCSKHTFGNGCILLTKASNTKNGCQILNNNVITTIFGICLKCTNLLVKTMHYVAALKQLSILTLLTDLIFKPSFPLPSLQSTTILIPCFTSALLIPTSPWLLIGAIMPETNKCGWVWSKILKLYPSVNAIFSHKTHWVWIKSIKLFLYYFEISVYQYNNQINNMLGI